MKGITPIISTIVLLLITVALAGAAWMYLSGFMGTYTEKGITASVRSASCLGSTFRVRVTNIGTAAIKDSDLKFQVVDSIAGTTVAGCTTATVDPLLPLLSKSSAQLSCTATTAPTVGNSYVIMADVGTSAVRETVVC